MKRDFRENWEAEIKRVDPLAIELRVKRKLMERLLREQCGPKYLLSRTKKTLKAVRYYVALSEPAARGLPNVITRVVDALPVKRAVSKRVNLPRAVLIQELNRIWHGFNNHDEWPLDVDETEKNINGTFILSAPKVVFFQTCFALASEELAAHEINRHWRVYRRKHLAAK